MVEIRFTCILEKISYKESSINPSECAVIRAFFAKHSGSLDPSYTW